MDELSTDELSAWAAPEMAGAPGDGGVGGSLADEQGAALSGAEFARECADRLDTLIEDLKGIRAAGDFPKKFGDLGVKLEPISEKLRDLADEYDEKHGEMSAAEREALAEDGGEDEEEESEESDEAFED